MKQFSLFFNLDSIKKLSVKVQKYFTIEILKTDVTYWGVEGYFSII